MRKIFSFALLALALGGCTTTATSRYGNFVPSAALDQHRLADDAVQQLAMLYAPAHTRLELQQPTPDPFGQALVKSLRDKGYALQEFIPASATTKSPASAPIVLPTATFARMRAMSTLPVLVALAVSPSASQTVPSALFSGPVKGWYSPAPMASRRASASALTSSLHSAIASGCAGACANSFA